MISSGSYKGRSSNECSLEKKDQHLYHLQFRRLLQLRIKTTHKCGHKKELTLPHLKKTSRIQESKKNLKKKNELQEIIILTYFEAITSTLVIHNRIVQQIITLLIYCKLALAITHTLIIKRIAAKLFL